MKHFKIKTLFLSLVISTSVSAQIQFEDNVPFQQVLNRSKSENKLIFIDCYTTWCGPCKWLVSNVFSDKKLGEIYNSQFVNYKLDMEKGEGLDLAKKFGVQAYPTLLWLNENEEVVYRIVGTNTIESFLGYASSLKDDENHFPSMVKKFEAGNREPEFLKKLALAAINGYDLNASIYVEAYLNTISKEDWSNTENNTFIYSASKTFDSNTTKHVLENSKKFEPTLVEAIKSQCLDYELRGALESKSEERLKVMLTMVDRYSPERQEYKRSAELYFYKTIGDRKKLNEMASKYLKSSKDPNLLNEYAWERFENETDLTLLKEAISWAERSVKLEKHFYNTDTLGQLYKKVGNAKKAHKWLKESKILEAKENQ